MTEAKPLQLQPADGLELAKPSVSQEERRMHAMDREPMPRAGRRAKDSAAQAREALSIDQVARQVLWQGKPLDLSPTEFDTLAYLIQRAGHPVPYDELLQAVWGASRAQGGSLPQVRSTVKRLRQ